MKENRQAEAFSFKDYEETIKEVIKNTANEDNAEFGTDHKWSVRVNKNSVVLHWSYEVNFKIITEDLKNIMENWRTFVVYTDYGWGLDTDHVEDFLIIDCGDRYCDYKTVGAAVAGVVRETIRKANRTF